MAAPRLVAALLLVASVAAPVALGSGSRTRCTSGPTLFVQGPMRIFAKRFAGGYDADACLGPSGPARYVGQYFANGGTSSARTSPYVFDGRRYVATFDYSDGEGGPTIAYDLYDLRTGRFRQSLGVNPVASPFRVTSNGGVINDDNGTVVLHPFHGNAVRLSHVGTKQVALVGGTAYWTEVPGSGPPVAASKRIPGASGTGEDYVLAPPHPRYRPDPCFKHRGKVVAASSSVRVYQTTSSTGQPIRFACIMGRAAVRGLGPSGVSQSTARDIRIAADRWLYTLYAYRRGAKAEQQATVIDMKTGRVVTNVDTAAGGPAITAATLLNDGTLAWLEQGGRVLAHRPGAAQRDVLALADTAPTTLASSSATVYWTAGGVAQRWAPGER